MSKGIRIVQVQWFRDMAWIAWRKWPKCYQLLREAVTLILFWTLLFSGIERTKFGKSCIPSSMCSPPLCLSWFLYSTVPVSAGISVHTMYFSLASGLLHSKLVLLLNSGRADGEGRRQTWCRVYCLYSVGCGAWQQVNTYGVFYMHLAYEVLIPSPFHRWGNREGNKQLPQSHIAGKWQGPDKAQSWLTPESILIIGIPHCLFKTLGIFHFLPKYTFFQPHR